MPTHLNILVVGAGIAGLATATALHRRGMTVDVIERSLSPRSTGAGLFLTGNSVRALTALGLQERLTASGAPVPSQRLQDHRGRVLAEIKMADLWRGTADCVGITRADLHSALHDVLPVPVRHGVTLQSLKQSGDGVEVEFNDALTGRYDVVVGADGIRSGLRALVDPAADTRYVGQVCWRFLTDDKAGIDRWTVWLGRGTAFLAYPVGQGRLCCYVDISAPSPKDPTDGTADLSRFFSGFDPRVRDLLATPAGREAYFAPVEEVSGRTWTAGRVVLVGDAAHASSPNMAQGVAMAVEDAHVLAETLATAGDTADLLRQYAQRRLPRTTWVQRQTHQRDRTRSMLPAVRTFVLRHGAERLWERATAPLRELP
ncbi:FAD-dependent oxidoreductase [Streptomyces sp. NPDC002668]|uniref:FAD-dependent oxidoreductase n=1 Tax=Streptomyces sp. NPDC002668 TaxID=3154422 RepID=UPI0033168EAC